MNFRNFLGNWIVRNLLMALGVILLLALAAGQLLRCTTNHGKVEIVPDFTAMTRNEASSLASQYGMRTSVVDSIYVKGMKRGCVVRQTPKAGSEVKKGRCIKLTINALSPKKVPMPNLIGYSLRSASAELSSRGLELGNLIYISDIATNNVIRQLYRKRDVAPGRMVRGESSIDLVLGLNDYDNTTSVPNVIGRPYKRAVELIHENCLNVGGVIFDRNIKTYKDSTEAIVYRQSPGNEVSSILMGRTVTLYLQKALPSNEKN